MGRIISGYVYKLRKKSYYTQTSISVNYLYQELIQIKCNNSCTDNSDTHSKGPKIRVDDWNETFLWDCIYDSSFLLFFLRWGVFSNVFQAVIELTVLGSFYQPDISQTQLGRWNFNRENITISWPFGKLARHFLDLWLMQKSLAQRGQ